MMRASQGCAVYNVYRKNVCVFDGASVERERGKDRERKRKKDVVCMYVYV